MKLRKTEAERNAALDNPKWSTRFALLPTLLSDGSVIWLESYEWARVRDHSSALNYSGLVRRPCGSNDLPWWAKPMERPPAPTPTGKLGAPMARPTEGKIPI